MISFTMSLSVNTLISHSQPDLLFDFGYEKINKNESKLAKKSLVLFVFGELQN